ncbi:MAG: tail fiber domain-containing protein [Candidatus Pacebacteria bacterium]|nr:tail fiber domain-containing protein [Candidatus Paceibacterota bacterium]
MPSFQSTQRKKDFKTKLFLSSLVFIILFSFFIFTKNTYAVDGLFNGKFLTGETDNYLFWLQTYDVSTPPYYTDRFFVSKDGLVGIGTASPGAVLDVQGTGTYSILANSQRIGNVASPVDNSDAANKSYVDSNAGDTDWVISGSDQYSGVSGNVGIGTNSPSEKLDVVGKISLNDGGNSVFIGEGAGLNDDASDNSGVGIGSFALYSNSTGARNIAIGRSSLSNNTTGQDNVAIGSNVLNRGNNSSNTAIGSNSMYAFFNGNSNTAIGAYSMYLSVNGNSNVAAGFQSLYNNDGDANTAIGYRSLYNNDDGDYNVGLGVMSLYNNLAGSYNIAIGISSLYDNNSGLHNIAIGYQASDSNTSGSNNVVLGYRALRGNATGGENIAFGSYAGSYINDGVTLNNNSVNNIFLGPNTKSNGSGETNQVVIGYNAVGNGSDSVTIGNDSITKTVLKGVVTVGTPIEDYHATTKAYVDSTIGGGTGSTVGYWTMSGDDIYNSNSGNVGIGFNSPSTKLAVDGNVLINTNNTDSDSALVVRVDNAYDGIALKGVTSPRMFFDEGTDGSETQLAFFGIQDSDNAFVMRNWGGSGNDLLYSIQSGGGRAAAADSEAMQVFHSGQVALNATWAASIPDSQLYMTVNSATLKGITVKGAVSQSANLQEWQDSNDNTLSVVDSAGNVGIGTTNPQAPLHLQATASTRENLFKGTVSDGGNDAFFITNATSVAGRFVPNFGGYIDSTNAAMSLQFTGLVSAANDAADSASSGVVKFIALRTDSATDPMNGTLSAIQNRKLFTFEGSAGPMMTIAASGNVGIGTTSASEKLVVNGNIEADAFYYSSDLRLKEDIEPLEDSLYIVNHLNPISFTFKDSKTKSQGFIAQEVEPLLPDLVKTNPETGLKSIQYGNLTAVLVGAIKEQSEQIKKLETELEILKLQLQK